ncbi:leukocyte surface antigen CD53 [Lampris incognitus]|uniref:leukocyte surface antigen CD53 n=1 Tax=Lampris incognitus TaxID=2546036 RepID=UPI0024B5FA6D|nr:leukocyte surface antigen CD53 [Lampris incognitus]
MSHSCLKCLKLTMCVVNFLCFVCGIAVMGLGIYMMMTKFTSLTPTFAKLNMSNMLLICGIIITCVSFMGFLGALKENRCFLIMFFVLLLILMVVELVAACLLLLYGEHVNKWIEKDLKEGLAAAIKKTRENSTAPLSDWNLIQNGLHCCGVHNATEWGDLVPASCCSTNPCDKQDPKYKPKGCLDALSDLFEDHFVTAGISVIVLCIIEVLGMCFSMTLFCHISRSGLGYKL